jgi:hypothetical protein
MVALESTRNLLLDQREGNNLLALGQARNIKTAQRVSHLEKHKETISEFPLHKVATSKK